MQPVGINGIENLEILKSEKYQNNTLELVGINGKRELKSLTSVGAHTSGHARRQWRRVRARGKAISGMLFRRGSSGDSERVCVISFKKIHVFGHEMVARVGRG